jgi:DNA polymerase-1
MVAEAKRTATLITQYAARGKEEFNIDNLNSEEELSRVLFAPGACTCGARTDTGKPKLDETTLLGYDHPLVPLVLDYREVLKVNGTYLNPIIAKLDANGHIHGNLNQVGARTGRMSSSAPNLQNISRSGGIVDLRRGFICEPDYKMLLIDLSQIELRVLAHYCKEQVMLDTLRDRKGDLHAATANVIFGSAAGAGAVSLTAKQQRTIAKTINFATIYGAGAAKLCHTLNKAVPDAGFTQQQTRLFKRAYLKGYPLLQEFIWAVERTIRESGFVFDIFGRKYYCDPKFAYRGVNYLVQGCSAGIAKLAACRLHQLMARRKSGLINLIHDEFVIALHPEDEALVPEMMRVVEDFTQFRVPIYANASISDTNWSDKRDLILP